VKINPTLLEIMLPPIISLCVTTYGTKIKGLTFNTGAEGDFFMRKNGLSSPVLNMSQLKQLLYPIKVAPRCTFC
jgi:hypothetical protein